MAPLQGLPATRRLPLRPQDFAITNWYLLFDFSIDDYTWQSDFVLEQVGSQVGAALHAAAGSCSSCALFLGLGAAALAPPFI